MHQQAFSRTGTATEPPHQSVWQQWVQRPERLWLRNCMFYVHLWVGAIVGMYAVLMSITGSLIVFRNELARVRSLGPFVEWVVNFHENLLLGQTGRFVNGLGAASVIVLSLTGAVIWWPGIKNWRRALTFNWRSVFARFSWDLHSAIGFWSFLFVLMWGVSGFYFSFPNVVNATFELFDPRDRFADTLLFWLSMLHFGRFGLFAEAVWTLAGLIPGLLAVTGVFLCCRRVIFRKPSPKPF